MAQCNDLQTPISTPIMPIFVLLLNIRQSRYIIDPSECILGPRQSMQRMPSYTQKWGDCDGYRAMWPCNDGAHMLVSSPRNNQRKHECSIWPIHQLHNKHVIFHKECWNWCNWDEVCWALHFGCVMIHLHNEPRTYTFGTSMTFNMAYHSACLIAYILYPPIIWLPISTP